MKMHVLIPLFGLFACGGGTGKKEPAGTGAGKDTLVVEKEAPAVPPPPPVSPDVTAINNLLQYKFPGQWHVLQDAEATWMKDVFDYFIVPKRKEHPDYPYISKGDFNGDGQPDRAALVTDSSKRQYRVAVLFDSTVIFWEEDIIGDAALSTVPKSEITGMEKEKEKKVKMKGDGIQVEYFEKAAFVLYWDKKRFNRLQTGD